MAEYPEHDKLTTIKEKSQAFGEFLDMAREHGYELCEIDITDKGTSFERVHYIPRRKTIENILAELFDIDLKKLESEKQRMLSEIRGNY